MGVGADGEVEAVAVGVDVGEGRALADAVHVVLAPGAQAGVPGMVHVRVLGKPGGQCGFVEGLGEGVPVLSLVPVDADGAVGAVVLGLYPRRAHVLVGLHLPEVGQHPFEGPQVVPGSRPCVVVGGDSPEEHRARAVVGAAPSHDLGPGHQHGLSQLGRGDAHVVPAMARVLLEGGLGGAVLEVVGQVLEVRVVGAGLQQQDGPARVLGQPGCQDAPAGARPHHDDVVLH